MLGVKKMNRTEELIYYAGYNKGFWDGVNIGIDIIKGCCQE